MFIHKYVADGKTYYLVNSSPSKPGMNVTLSTSDWQGRSSTSMVNKISKFLTDLKFSKEEKEDEKETRVSRVARMFIQETEN